MSNRLYRGALKLVAGIGLASLFLATAHALLHLGVHGRATWHCLLGFSLGMIVFTALAPFMPMYVLGHELTHWFIAKLCGRRTGRIRLGRQDGSVAVDNPNIWIVLGPYFVPFYALVWPVAWSLAGLWYRPSWHAEALLIGAGVGYAFHLVLTIKVLRGGQSDLQHYGPVFSMLLILAANLLLLYLALAVLSGNLAAVPAGLWRGFKVQVMLLRRWF